MNKKIYRYRLLPLLGLMVLSIFTLNAQEQKQSRFFWGGGVSIALSDYLDIDVSPRVGYRITPSLSAGVLAKYQYVNFKNEVEPYKSNTYGGGVFAQYNLTPLFSSQPLPFNIYAHTEYQYLYTKLDWKYQSHTTSDNRDRWFVGGGFSVPFGSRSYFYTTILYDILTVIRNENNEYRNKPVISVGVIF